MNGWDVLLSILILAILVLAVRHCILAKKNGGSCCGDCTSCDKQCHKK